MTDEKWYFKARDDAARGIKEATNPVEAAAIAFKAICDFSDLEMLDGDAARTVADAWLTKFQPWLG